MFNRHSDAAQTHGGGSAARIVRAAIAGLVVVSACGHPAALPFYQSAEMTPEWLPAARATHHVASFRLADQNGATITNDAFRGKVTIVHFFFTRCGDVCPTTTTNLARTLHAIGDSRLQVLSHSVTPDADSVTTLRRYAEMHHIVDPRWHLLTGSRADIEMLAHQSYFVRLGKDSTYGVASIAHTETVLLVDGEGRLRGVYAGTLALEMDRLREDILTLL